MGPRFFTQLKTLRAAETEARVGQYSFNLQDHEVTHMRMLLKVKFPIEPFNTAVKDGSAGKKIKRILDEIKPEAAYFTAIDGHRGGIMIVDLPDPSKIPSIAEPWFLQFHAECEVHPVMTSEDLAKGGLEELGKKWS